VTDRLDDRAQLLLLGSVTIALVVVGLTVLVNTVLFTESIGSSSLDNRIDETSEYDSEVITGVRSLTFRIGHNSWGITESQLRGWIAENVTRYSHAMGMSYAVSRPVAVSVEYSNASELGNRTVQNGDSNITSSGGNERWEMVDDKTVGWFTLNVDLRDTDRAPTHFNATNATGGDWVNISVNRTGAGTITVESVQDGGGSVTTTCSSVDGRVLLDLYAGTALTNTSSACSFIGTGTVDGPHRVSVTNGDAVVGKYSLVTREAVSGYPSCADASAGQQEPCVSPVLWSVNVSMAFEGESINYANTYSVDIYGEQP
jgi:hypothetical protein